jgi:hypothetical protein
MTTKPCNFDSLALLLDDVSNAIASFDDPSVATNAQLQDDIQYAVNISFT